MHIILNLSGNELIEIKENTFACIQNLKVLDLQCSYLSDINVNTFKDLINLKELKLYGNQLKKLKENADLIYDLNEMRKLNKDLQTDQTNKKI